MNTNKSFSPERLFKIRRLRRARYLWKKEPLFALTVMKMEYPDYTEQMFISDLYRRSKRKSRYKKNPLKKYGRYYEMQRLIDLYEQDKNPDHYHKAMRLRQNMTKPYRFQITIQNNRIEYELSPLIPFNKIVSLSQSCNSCKTIQEAATLVGKFIDDNAIGGG